MEVHEFESMLIMAGIPMHWFSVLAKDGKEVEYNGKKYIVVWMG